MSSVVDERVQVILQLLCSRGQAPPSCRHVHHLILQLLEHIGGELCKIPELAEDADEAGHGEALRGLIVAPSRRTRHSPGLDVQVLHHNLNIILSCGCGPTGIGLYGTWPTEPVQRALYIQETKSEFAYACAKLQPYELYHSSVELFTTHPCLPHERDFPFAFGENEGDNY